MKTIYFIKTVLILLVLSQSISSCKSKNKQEKQNENIQNSDTLASNNTPGQIEVLVLHGVKQCETCHAIKEHTKEVVDANFPEEAKSGKIVFKIIDFSIPENKAIAEKYEVAWTSLVVVKHKESGEEEFENMGAFAIENARNNTALFKQTLKEKIKKLLETNT